MRKPYLERIYGDLYFVSERLKEIDDTYYIVYNHIKKRYEVHSDEQRGDTLCFVVPFATLDARTVDYAKKTRNPVFCKTFTARSVVADEIKKEIKNG